MKIHFIGIGGASLSKLALIYKSMGYDVSGSDRTETYTTNELKNLGINVFYEHKKENVFNCEMVVYSDAINENNPEIISAKHLGIPLISRKVALNLIANLYDKTLAVCGCHGKTTTTALLSYALKSLKPQMHIGGEINNIGLTQNYYNDVVKASKSKKVFITEACEFKKNLLELNPNYIVMLNIDADHLDCYKNLDEIKDTFLTFAKKLENNTSNVLFCNADDKNTMEVAKLTNCKKITFGINNSADYTAKNINLSNNGLTFDLYYENKKIKNISCKLYGKHNVINVLAVCSVAEYFKTKHHSLFNYKNKLKEFKGVKRRFEILGEKNGNLVIHDYAHHPTEIIASITAAREHFNKPIVIAFEPHTYTRTQSLWNEFKQSLSLADYGYLLDIYSAREEPIENITSKNLANEINNITYVESYEKCKEMLSKVKNSVILILGAGSIENLAHELME